MPQLSTSRRPFSKQGLHGSLDLSSTSLKGAPVVADAQDEDQLEEKELQLHREESAQLIEANEEWFKQYEKEFEKGRTKQGSNGTSKA